MINRKLAALTCLASLGAPLLGANVSRAETIATDGRISLEVNFQTVPVAQHVEDMKAYLTRASQVLCDATEGQLVVSDVRFTSGPSGEGSAEIIYQATPESRSFASGGQVFLYPSPSDGDSYKRTGMTIAHELGHSILDLGDSYK